MRHTSALPHADWHRVALLRPRLSAGVRIKRQWLRGERWHVLQDALGRHHCRLSAAAYEAIGRLNGQITLDELWQALDAQGDAAHEPPDQDELLALIRQLHGQQLLSFDAAPDFGTLPAGMPAPDANKAARQANSVLAWRMPLLDPSAWLDRSEALGRTLFSPAGGLLWLASMLALAWGLLLHHAALLAHARIWMPTPAYLLMAALAYPVIKALHEAAHALCVRRWGGQVHEAGVVWMLGLPAPYVDASAAHGFPHAWQRAMVSAAGIQCELALASAGLWLWQSTPPGRWHDIGFILWFVGGVSTLLFNANPLQRLDGYHLLSDLLHLPNWATRSQQWWAQQRRALLWGQATPAQASLHTAPGERPWLMAYAPLAWAYQLLLWLGMTWWLGSLSAWLGWAMAAFTAWQWLLRPSWQACREAWQGLLWAPVAAGAHAPLAPRLRRASALLMLPVLMLAMMVPWPVSMVVPGVVWAPDDALVRPDTDGLVATVHRADGEQVHAGDLIASLHNPRLLAEHEGIAARLAQAQYQQFSQQNDDRAKAGQAGDEVLQWQGKLAHIEAQIAALQVRSHRDGRLVLPLAADLPGQYLHRGAVLGHVLTGQPPLVRVAVAESEVADLRQGTPRVSVRVSGPATQALPASLMRDAMGATRQLPSAALSQAQGGEVLTEPQDEHHLQTVRPVVLMDVLMAGGGAKGEAGAEAASGERLGQRAWVRFDLGWSPPLWRALRWLGQRARQDFNPNR
jgi:putative peptide zinc metalloprotease protein